MTDRLDLLRAILADPDSDTPRLVYADWLDDHGTTEAVGAGGVFWGLACGEAGRRGVGSSEV